MLSIAHVRKRIYEKFDEAAPQYRLGHWRQVFETDAAKSLYELPLKKAQFANDFRVERDNVWRRILTKSYIAVLSEEERQKLKKEVYEIIDDPEAGYDGLYPHDTDLVWAKKRL